MTKPQSDRDAIAQQLRAIHEQAFVPASTSDNVVMSSLRYYPF